MNIILPALLILSVLLVSTYVGVRLYIQRKLINYGAGGGTRRLVRKRNDSSSSALLLILVVMFSVSALFLLVLVLSFA